VTHSVCPYCAIGCGLLVFTKGKRPIAIEGNPDSPVNQGRLCPKGANTLQLVDRNGDDVAVNHLKTVASLGGATLDNEENYLLKKLFTGGLGILPIENQARL